MGAQAKLKQQKRAKREAAANRTEPELPPPEPVNPFEMPWWMLLLALSVAAVGAVVVRCGGWIALHRLERNQVAPVYRVPLLDAEECQELVAAATAEGGWDTAADKYFQTRDRELSKMAALGEGYEGQLLRGRVLPLMAELYGVRPDRITMDRGLHIVEYKPATEVLEEEGDEAGDEAGDAAEVADEEADEEPPPTAGPGIPMHQDGSQISINIALSDPGDFEGGGVYFRVLNETLAPAAGTALIHAGGLYHRGENITAGSRYVLVGFASVRQLGWDWATETWGDHVACSRVETCHRGDDGMKCTPEAEPNCRPWLAELWWTLCQQVGAFFGQAELWDRVKYLGTNIGGVFMAWGMLLSIGRAWAMVPPEEIAERDAARKAAAKAKAEAEAEASKED